MDNNKTDGNSILFIAGMVFGITLTALLTPRSGEQIRDNIRQKIDDVKEKTYHAADKVTDIIEDKSEEAKKVFLKTKDIMDA